MMTLLGSIWYSPGTAQAQDLIALDDAIVVNSGSEFDARFLLMGNDTVVDDDSVLVVITQPPTHGDLEWLGGSMWRYTARNGYVGPDSFGYRLQTLPLQRLAFDPTVSSLTFDASVTTLLGTSDDSEVIAIEGHVDADMGADVAALDSLQIVAVNAVNRDFHSLRFEYGSPFTVGTLRIEAQPQGIGLFLVSAGPRVETTGFLRSFEQTGNEVGIRVQAQLSGTGVLSSAVPNEQQNLETSTSESMTGSLIASGSRIVTIINIDSQYEFDLDGNAVRLAIAGSLQALGDFRDQRSSTDALVTLDVQAATDAEHPDRIAYELDVYPNPANHAFRVSWDAPGRLEAPVTIDVIDVLGRSMHSIPVGDRRLSHSEQIDASLWSPGVYFVRIRSHHGVDVRPIVVR